VTLVWWAVPCKGNAAVTPPADLEADDDGECWPCPKGTFSKPPTPGCGKCSPGWCENVTFCRPCEPGFHNDNLNSSFCAPCDDGWVAPSPRTAVCLSCRAAETSSTNHTRCVACMPGYYNPRSGGVCLACDKGTYSERKSYNCTSCPPGTYNGEMRQAQCTDCGAGRWSTDKGRQVPCPGCPRGYYCPNARTILPLPCPADHYCPSAAPDPSACPLLFKAPPISGSCDPSVWFYVVISVVGGVVLAFALVVWFVVSRKRRKVMIKKKERSEAEKLIPPPLPGPEYSGL